MVALCFIAVEFLGFILDRRPHSQRRVRSLQYQMARCFSYLMQLPSGGAAGSPSRAPTSDARSRPAFEPPR